MGCVRKVEPWGEGGMPRRGPQTILCLSHLWATGACAGPGTGTGTHWVPGVL